MKSLILLAVIAIAGGTATATPRVPAEWEPQSATWMQWPHGIESSYRPDFARIIGAIQGYEHLNLLTRTEAARGQAEAYLAARGVPLNNVTFHVTPYNWAWMRDNGPVWVEQGGGLTAQDWAFDAWGGIIAPWNLDDAVPAWVAQTTGHATDAIGTINERGALEFNGAGALITTWPVFADRNPGMTRAEHEVLFAEKFGVTQIVWLETAPADDEFTGGHVDGIARFIDVDTVAVARHVDQSDVDAPVYEEAVQIISAAGFEVVRIDIPGKVSYQGSQMSANYVNWLVINGAVIVTGFNKPAWDNAAASTIQGFFPGRDVLVVDCREIWYWGGGVHCVTNDQPISQAQPCSADLDANGLLNVDDVDAFTTFFLAGDLAVDFDGNGLLNVDDVDAFVAAFLGGCP
ncbi:MAG: agmatine deiminase [Phycisphaeraceae bacterium]|nr:MAG: agmatine deiminase [Phycisphaeraceae bacterium]